MVAGKGGVGKTTVGASLGLAAAQDGFDVLLIELEGHSNLGAAFGCDQLGYEDQLLVASDTRTSTADGPTTAGQLRGRQLTPERALRDYLDTHEIGKIANRLAGSGLIDLVASAVPGIRDVVTLGKIRQLEESSAADLIIVDAPASGHSLTFLTSAGGLQNVVEDGPIRTQADQVAEMLADQNRCQTILVTLPEQTPVSEVVDTAFRIEDELDIHLGPVVVNTVIGGTNRAYPEELTQALRTPKVDPRARLAGEYRLQKATAQQTEVVRLAQELPLSQVLLPALDTPRIGREDLALLASEIRSQLAETPL